ncbi:MAG TPA: hypothetical protein VNO21_14815 [Polyangiaceae bacterium]|nr:hypothetical protein [Polyangiaceae bacterium]
MQPSSGASVVTVADRDSANSPRPGGLPGPRKFLLIPRGVGFALHLLVALLPVIVYVTAIRIAASALQVNPRSAAGVLHSREPKPAVC